MPKGSIGIVPLPTPEEQAEKALDELDASREPDEISAGQPPERSIGEAPVMQAPVSENPEDDVESLQEKMIESDMTSAGDGSDIAAPFGKTISEDDEKRNRKRVIFLKSGLKSWIMRRFSPLAQRRIRAFATNRRALTALVAFVAVFALTLLAELIANDRPLLLKYDGKLYFPVLPNIRNRNSAAIFRRRRITATNLFGRILRRTAG